MAYMEKEELIGMYLDYVNNYLTVDKFASDNLLTYMQAIAIINRGRYLNDLESLKRKV